MNATENRRRNSYASNCCKCRVFVEQGRGWLYQDTQSSHRDARIKKHWKVKCDNCHSKAIKQETVEKMSVAEAKKLIKEHGKRFDVAIVAEWENEKVATFDGNPLDNFAIKSYLWVSPEQFVFLTTGEEVSDFNMTERAYALLESFCLDLDAKRLGQ